MNAHLLTVKQWTHREGISRMTFYRWLREGKMQQAVRRGTRWLIPKSVTSVTLGTKQQHK